MKHHSSKPTLSEYLGQMRDLAPPAVAAIVIVVLGLLVLKPRVQLILGVLNERRKLRENLSRVVANLDKLENADKELYQRQLVLLTQAVPSEPDLPSLLLNIDRQAGQTGVVIEGATFEKGSELPKSAEKSLSSIGIQIAVRGRQNQLSSFIRQLEMARRLISVDKIQISSGPVSVASPSAVFNSVLNLTVFFAPLPESLGPPETVLTDLTAEDKVLISEIQNRLEGFSGESTGPSLRTATAAANETNPFEP